MNSSFFQENTAENGFEGASKNHVVFLLNKSLIKERGAELRIKSLENRVRALQVIIAEYKQGNLDLVEAEILSREHTFGKSSEKSTQDELAASLDPSLQVPGAFEPTGEKKEKKKRNLLPSHRYPNVEIKETHVYPEQGKGCSCGCMKLRDTGLTETTERLSVIAKKFVIERQVLHKDGCPECHGTLQTAPKPPSITPGGAFSDALMIDVAINKYCDLLPIHRYVNAATRGGVVGLPQNSLIECTHQLSLHVRVAYRMLKKEVLASRILHADETPHRMLEGDEKEHWSLWGFSNPYAAYFEAHDTRSGDVASDLLKDSKCEFLVSDVFSGYAKAIRVTNEYRKTKDLLLMQNVYCNTHGRRGFHKAKLAFEAEANYFLERYRKIYYLESQLTILRNKDPNLPEKTVLEIRGRMRIFFEEMKARAIQEYANYSSKSSIARAMSYFLNNYAGLTLFLVYADLPIDNNPAERILRNPVIGRKTWYGTHSRLGAETMAVMFSIIESCKLNKVNPSQYFTDLVQALHRGEPAFTPHDYMIRLQKQN